MSKTYIHIYKNINFFIRVLQYKYKIKIKIKFKKNKYIFHYFIRNSNTKFSVFV